MAKLFESVVSLYFVHVVRLILPLVLMPLLARRVDEDAFALYLYSISFIAWCSVFIEYGFNISTTRSISRSDDKFIITKIIVASQSGRVLLAFFSIILIPIAAFALRPFQDNFDWLVCAWVAAIFTAGVPLFYYQGTERMRPLALFELTAGGLLLVGALLLVKLPSDSNKIPLIIVCARFTAFAAAQTLMVLDLGKAALSVNLKAGIQALKVDVHMFVFQALASLYTSFNVVLLGLFVGVYQVALFAAAEKLIRAGLGFIGQASNAIFPRLSRVKDADPLRFQRYRKLSLLIFFMVGLAATVCIIIVAPILIPWFFDNKFNGAIEIIKILAWIVPGIALNNVLGFQYLLIANKEKLLNRVIMFGGALNLVLVIVFVGLLDLGVRGMAYSWLTVEWAITALLGVIVYFQNSHRDTLHFIVSPKGEKHV